MGTRGSSGARGPGREGVPGRATVVVSIRRGLFSPVWGAGGPSSTGVELIKPSGDTVRSIGLFRRPWRRGGESCCSLKSALGGVDFLEVDIGDS
jgi:hypothetical protein